MDPSQKKHELIEATPHWINLLRNLEDSPQTHHIYITDKEIRDEEVALMTPGR